MTPELGSLAYTLLAQARVAIEQAAVKALEDYARKLIADLHQIERDMLAPEEPPAQEVRPT